MEASRPSRRTRRIIRGEYCGAKKHNGNVCFGKRMGPGLRCAECSHQPELRPFQVPYNMPGLPARQNRNAGTLQTALWQIAAGVMAPEAREALLALADIRPDLKDQILIMQSQMLALMARHGRGEISQEAYDSALLALSEQIRKLFESQAKVRQIEAELAKYTVAAYGEDALDPETLND